MADTKQDTAAFFAEGTVTQFQQVLNLYPDVLKLKAELKTKKPEELVKLDNWYQNELPKKIKARGKDAHCVHEELVQLMKWKQARGKFYPQLNYLIKVNTPRAVINETKKAFKKLPNLEQAITALSNLKGVGTTMASALLAAAAPDIAPFMADECLLAIPAIEGIDYTTKEYMNFVSHIQNTSDRLSKEAASNGASGPWSLHKVELALWTHFVASELKPELLGNIPCANGSHQNGDVAGPSDKEVNLESTMDTETSNSPQTEESRDSPATDTASDERDTVQQEPETEADKTEPEPEPEPESTSAEILNGLNADGEQRPHDDEVDSFFGDLSEDNIKLVFDEDMESEEESEKNDTALECEEKFEMDADSRESSEAAVECEEKADTESEEKTSEETVKECKKKQELVIESANESSVAMECEKENIVIKTEEKQDESMETDEKKQGEINDTEKKQEELIDTEMKSDEVIDVEDKQVEELDVDVGDKQDETIDVDEKQEDSIKTKEKQGVVECEKEKSGLVTKDEEQSEIKSEDKHETVIEKEEKCDTVFETEKRDTVMITDEEQGNAEIEGAKKAVVENDEVKCEEGAEGAILDKNYGTASKSKENLAEVSKENHNAPIEAVEKKDVAPAGEDSCSAIVVDAESPEENQEKRGDSAEDEERLAKRSHPEMEIDAGDAREETQSTVPEPPAKKAKLEDQEIGENISRPETKDKASAATANVCEDIEMKDVSCEDSKGNEKICSEAKTKGNITDKTQPIIIDTIDISEDIEMEEVKIPADQKVTEKTVIDVDKKADQKDSTKMDPKENVSVLKDRKEENANRPIPVKDEAVSSDTQGKNVVSENGAKKDVAEVKVDKTICIDITGDDDAVVVEGINNGDLPKKVTKEDDTIAASNSKSEIDGSTAEPKENRTADELARVNAPNEEIIIDEPIPAAKGGEAVKDKQEGLVKENTASASKESAKNSTPIEEITIDDSKETTVPEVVTVAGDEAASDADEEKNDGADEAEKVQEEADNEDKADTEAGDEVITIDSSSESEEK